MKKGLPLIAGILVLAIVGGAAWFRRTPPPTAAPPTQAPSPDRREWGRQLRESPEASRPALLLAASAQGDAAATEFLGDVAASRDRLAPQATEALSRTSKPAALAALREIARWEDPPSSAAAIRALGGFRDPADIELLAGIVRSRPGTRSWQEAVRALGAQKQPQTREILEGALRQAATEQDRLTVLSAFLSAGRKENAPVLERHLARTDLTATERTYAGEALRASR